MEESRKVYGWLVRDRNAAVGCSSMWADTRGGENYCGNLLWQSSLTLLSLLSPPIGWHRRGASDEMFLVPFSDFELHLNQNSRPLVIASQYCQRFSIDTDGVFKIEKYGHWISRSPSCRVILDGVVLQETHQP